jgi:hypothetical protein
MLYIHRHKRDLKTKAKQTRCRKNQMQANKMQANDGRGVLFPTTRLRKGEFFLGGGGLRV